MNLESDILKLEGPIFVFGASGFIGANVVETLLSYRNDVYAISHNPKSAWRLKLMQVDEAHLLYCDINYKSSLETIVELYQPKTVFNLSAYGAYSKQTNHTLTYQTNFIGTLNILEVCKNIRAYIHAGSSSEYGLNCTNPDEDSSLIPNSHYAVSKISSSYLINYYGKFLHVPCLNLRLYSIYGPWEEPDRLVPKIVELGRKGEYPPLVSPETTRDFVYVLDCVHAFIKAALHVNPTIAGNSYNIGSGVKTTLLELTEIAQEQFGIADKPNWGNMEARNWDTKEWVGNYTRALQDFGWKPEITLREGIAQYADWQVQSLYEQAILPAFNEPQKLLTISAIVACYKDAQAIPDMYNRLVKTYSKIGCNYEIIFVNDNSPDNTQQVLEEICAKDTNVIAIKHSRNFGSQAAFSSGMEISTGDAVVLMDGDLQDPPELIEDFVVQWREGYEVVFGRRIKREASIFMNFAYKAFYKVFSRLSYITIPKDAGDFSLIDRKVVEHLIALPEKEQFLRGLRAWLGFKQIGVDYVRPERAYGVTTNNIWKNIWWAKKGIFSFSYAPLEFMSYGGIALTMLSIVAIGIQTFMKFVHPDIPHGISTIIVLILFFGGVQLLAMSIIGEYLAKVLEESKDRPKFIRDSVILKGKKIEKNSELNRLLK